MPPTSRPRSCCSSWTSEVDVKVLLLGSGGREHALAWKL
ncbi:MAG: hypothetical protein EOO71_20840, partial [Myxococcaceae bacterium]